MGSSASAYVETDPAEANRESIIRNFLSGQYGNAVQVVAFNTAEGWSWDVSEDIAREVLQRAIETDENLGEDAKRFIDRHVADSTLPGPSAVQTTSGRPDRPPQARFREAAGSAIGAAQGDLARRPERS